MKRDDIKKMILSQGNVLFDDLINNHFNFSDFDKKLLNNYLRLAGLRKEGDLKKILFNLGVADS